MNNRTIIKIQDLNGNELINDVLTKRLYAIFQEIGNYAHQITVTQSRFCNVRDLDKCYTVTCFAEEHRRRIMALLDEFWQFCDALGNHVGLVSAYHNFHQDLTAHIPDFLIPVWLIYSQKFRKLYILDQSGYDFFDGCAEGFVLLLSERIEFNVPGRWADSLPPVFLSKESHLVFINELETSENLPDVTVKFARILPCG